MPKTQLNTINLYLVSCVLDQVILSENYNFCIVPHLGLAIALLLSQIGSGS